MALFECTCGAVYLTAAYDRCPQCNAPRPRPTPVPGVEFAARLGKAPPPRKPTDTLTRLQAQFEQFHKDNPAVYGLLVRYAKEAKAAGCKLIGIALLVERVRWQVFIDTKAADPFKISNNHRAYYSRKIMQENPDLRGLFKLRPVEC